MRSRFTVRLRRLSHTLTTQTPSRRFLTPAEAHVAARREAKPYINPYLGGILLGIVLFAALFITGNGLGASGGINRIVVFVQDLIAPTHVDRTAYLTSMAGGDLNPLDNWIVFITLGTLLGGFVSGWANHRVRSDKPGRRVDPSLRGHGLHRRAIMATALARLHLAKRYPAAACCRWAVGRSCSPFSAGVMRSPTSCAASGTDRRTDTEGTCHGAIYHH